MNDNSSTQLLWARCAKRCFLYLTLCLVALGAWSLPAPEPLATAGNFNTSDHFLNDQSGVLAHHAMPRPAPPDYRKSEGDGDPAFGSSSPVLLHARTTERLRLPRPAQLVGLLFHCPQSPRAPPLHS